MAILLNLDICDRLEGALEAKSIPAMGCLQPGLTDEEIDEATD